MIQFFSQSKTVVALCVLSLNAVALDVRAQINPASDPLAEGLTYSTQLSLKAEEESILFSAAKIADLERVLRVYEFGEDIDISDIAPARQQEPGQEPEALPAFYYSSLIYRNANDWKAWVNGVAYSAQQNNVSEEESLNDIQVKLISNNQIKVIWNTGTYLPQVISAWRQKDDEQKVLPYLHRLSKTQGTPDFDLTEGTLSFTLKPNQTFVVDHFDVVEGKYTYLEEPTSLAEAEAVVSNVGNAETDTTPLANIAPKQGGDMSDLINRALSQQSGNTGEGGDAGAGVSPLQEIQKEILKSIFSQ